MSDTTTPTTEQPPQPYSEQIQIIFQLGEKRARTAGHLGIVHMNDWLSKEEQKQLSAALRSMPVIRSPRPPQDV
ncbi:hypothetical protein [Synechococcus sp. PCC 6312]|uniref:hypothetical protein n=1 Tax=Synechococcus sp. (strain ATCC 27167 / PCC 6312) TaxID=195253 RepID=UPI00029ECB33|nr:hypothetical protein [Synechococcus sp. PCC 6312]AFY60660.1 hypothetical protein Syn6312_1495 [Synechococcus sp. PCC 6312]